MSFFAPTGARLDSAGMWRAVAALPEQIADAIDRAEEVPLVAAAPRGPVTGVVLCGTGESGIACDALAALAYPRLDVPVTVVKGYRLPAHVTSHSLVFAISCSGDTDETIEAATDARRRGATVVTVAGPGVLAASAADDGGALVPVPAGTLRARAAFGALAVPPLVVLERLGMWHGMCELLRAAADELVQSREPLLQADSVAGQLARAIGATVPLVHGSPGPTGVAATRWKAQINANAKTPAFCSLQPELRHGELAGWGRRPEAARKSLTLVALRYPGEHPQVAKSFSSVGRLMDHVVSNVIDVRSDASSDVSALFDLVFLGDFVSLHLAERHGVDPGADPALEHLGPSWRG